jgi:hypothetical protein
MLPEETEVEEDLGADEMTSSTSEPWGRLKKSLMKSYGMLHCVAG